MAMDDTLRLAQAVLIDGEMARPDRYVDLVPQGRWTTARIVDCSLYVNIETGFYFGTVRYQPKGQKYLSVKTFQDLFIEGWTTLRFRDEAIATQPRVAKRKKKAKR
jgi:hypothetical protein